MTMFETGDWLAYSFAGLMGLSMLIYAVLDGYDLGVGILTFGQKDEDRDQMIASIGPFWDANETWLVLGVGLLLVAFPAAHGVILTALYLPVAILLIGLIMRGVAFDFRAKAKPELKHYWNHVFFAGSFITAFAQGFMLGSYILGFEDSALAGVFSVLVGLGVVLAYCLIGAAWLIMKSEGELQEKAIDWARKALWGSALAVILVSIATPLVSERIFEKWFDFPKVILLLPVPLVTAGLVFGLHLVLKHLPAKDDAFCWVPFVVSIFIFVLSFNGLAYSFYPYIVPDQLTIVEAASAPESLMIILVGALFVLPILLGYTVLSYWIFHGKTRELRYD